MANRSMPEAERLAVLLDGKLGAMDRAELLRRVAESDEAIELLADAAAVLGADDVAAIDHSATAHPGAASRRWFKHPGTWMALAAGIAALAIAPWAWQRQLSQDTAPTRFAAAVVLPGGSTVSGWPDSGWSTRRGGTTLLAPSARAWRVGVRITDLALAAHQHDTSASRIATEAAALLEPIPGSAPVVALYRQLAKATLRNPDGTQLLQQTAGHAAARLLGADLVALGAWAEAARIASVEHDSAFFVSSHPPDSSASLSSRAWVSDTAPQHAFRIATRLTAQHARDWPALRRELAHLVSSVGR